MMQNINVLEEFLIKSGVRRGFFSFYEDKDGAICLEKINNEWRVYYSERGEKQDLGWGKSEEQALNILKVFVLYYSDKFGPFK